MRRTNRPEEIMLYLSSPGKPITLEEFNKFWRSLSAQDKYELLFGELR